MTNILEAIYNIINYSTLEIMFHNSGRNRVNNMGDALENYIKDAFANTFNVEDEQERMKVFNQKFSWLGNQNHPPDIMIKNGDAIEVKKLQSARSDLALNSSHPKCNIQSSSSMITKECKDCETWTSKDLIYCIGHTTDEKLKSLWMVYGNIYAAKHETYERIKQTMSMGINEIPDVEFSETEELGRVNRVDPLGITNLRIRGMWQIQNPRKVFEYLHNSLEAEFELVVIIPISKYEEFESESISKIESIKNESFSISDVEVRDPNNPVNLVECKMIKYSI